MNLFLEGFVLGNSSILANVCLLPLYPGMIAFLAGNLPADEKGQNWGRMFLGILVLLGVLTMMLVLGLIFTLINGVYEAALPVMVLVAYALVIVLGGMMVFGWNPFAKMATVQTPMLKNPYITAYLYGLLLAPMTLPCTGPLLLGAAGRALATGGSGAAFSELIFFMAFGVGFGWPLVLLPMIAATAQRQIIRWTTQHHLLISRVAGGLLVTVGILGLIVDRELVMQVFV